MLIGFLGMAFALYGTALGAPFIWDDQVIIQENLVLKGEVPVWEAFKRSVFGKKGAFLGFYRPLQVVSYWLDTHLYGGLSVVGMRATSVFIHALTGLGLFHVFRRLQFTYWISLILAMLYTVHPLCIEAVTYLSGRGDALVVLMFVWACLFWLKGGQGRDRSWLVMAGGLYLLSLLTKENGVLLPAVFLVLTYVNREQFGEDRRFAYRFAGGLLVVGALYSLIVVLRVSTQDVQSYSWLATAPLFQRVMTIPLSLWTYLKLTVFPVNLHMEYHFVEDHLLRAGVLLAGLMGVLGVLWRTLPKGRLVLWLSFIVAGWLPVNGVFPRLASSIREHWWMIPLIGVLGLLGEYLSRVFQDRYRPLLKSGVKITVATFLICLMGLTWVRNQDWKDPVQFYIHDLSLEPKAFVMYNNLGVLMHGLGHYKEAGQLFEQSILQSPDQKYSVAYNNYGVVLENFGQRDKAVQFYRESYRLTGYYLARQNLERLGLRPVPNDAERRSE